MHAIGKSVAIVLNDSPAHRFLERISKSGNLMRAGNFYPATMEEIQSLQKDVIWLESPDPEIRAVLDKEVA